MVWIEIIPCQHAPDPMTSPPARVVWIEILPTNRDTGLTPSPPARVVWIEIMKLDLLIDEETGVATREGGVD